MPHSVPSQPIEMSVNAPRVGMGGQVGGGMSGPVAGPLGGGGGAALRRALRDEAAAAAGRPRAGRTGRVRAAALKALALRNWRRVSLGCFMLILLNINSNGIVP